MEERNDCVLITDATFSRPRLAFAIANYDRIVAITTSAMGWLHGMRLSNRPQPLEPGNLDQVLAVIEGRKDLKVIVALPSGAEENNHYLCRWIDDLRSHGLGVLADTDWRLEMAFVERGNDRLREYLQRTNQWRGYLPCTTQDAAAMLNGSSAGGIT